MNINILYLEELKEFQSEFETTIGDKNERFRDLKLRDARISAFIENFDEIKRANQKHIDTLSEMVRSLLIKSLFSVILIVLGRQVYYYA